jgi:hypothetical protein
MEQRDNGMKHSRDETLVGCPQWWGIGSVLPQKEIFG